MKLLVLVVLLLGLSAAALGQRRPGPFWSLGGYGSVLFPTTGHAPATPPGGVTGPYFPRLWGHSRKTNGPQSYPAGIVASPVYDSGFVDERYGIDANGGPDPVPPAVAANPTPPVVINQSLIPPRENPQTVSYLPQNARRCADAQGDVAELTPATDSRPTIYLIAFEDHSVVQALGYWMQAGTLHYVSAEYGWNQVSIALIDRDLSRRLNDERGIEFKLPGQK